MGTHILGRRSRGAHERAARQSLFRRRNKERTTTEAWQKGGRGFNSRKSTVANGDRIPKKTRCLSSEKRARGREKAKIVDELRQRYPLNDLLKLSGLARSTFYYYLKHPNEDKYENEKQEITEIFNANKSRYGYRRVCTDMRNNGHCINHKTVQKLMKQLGLKGKQRKNGQYHS